MRIFKTRWFSRYARREKIADKSLGEAVARAERGLVDAFLGGSIIKQRIARKGQGRSGGCRVIIALRSGERAVFLYSFAKNEKDNIDPDELASLKEIGAAWLAADSAGLERAIRQGALMETLHES